MDFILVTVLIGLMVTAWVVVVRTRNKHATDEEMAGLMPRRRRSGRRRRSSTD